MRKRKLLRINEGYFYSVSIVILCGLSDGYKQGPGLAGLAARMRVSVKMNSNNKPSARFTHFSDFL